jgi:hypothetical protein
VTYLLRGEPLMTYACHCLDCQKRTGSAFSLGMMVPSEAIELQGNLAAWERTADTGLTNTRYSCQLCGNIIYGVGSLTPELYKLQPGTLNDTSEVEPDVHIWTSRKQPWLHIPEIAPCFEQQPGDVTEILSAALRFRARRNT